MDIPTIETERLVLRGFRPSDTEPFMAALARDEFAATITREGRGLDRSEAWRAMATINGSWSLDGFGNWVVVEKASGAPIGRLGPYAPPGWPDFEIGWAIFPEHQRQGYALEGAAAALIWCHEVLGRDYVTHYVKPGNIGSERVAAKLGGVKTTQWTAPWGTTVDRWETQWNAFVRTEAYERHAAFAPQAPTRFGGRAAR